MVSRTCAATPTYCHDDNWFRTGVTNELNEKFHLNNISFPFAFIDSWAKHPANIDDPLQQEAFNRESAILWNFAQSQEKFIFKSIQDVLEENNLLKSRVEYLRNFPERKKKYEESLGELTGRHEKMKRQQEKDIGNIKNQHQRARDKLDKSTQQELERIKETEVTKLEKRTPLLIQR